MRLEQRVDYLENLLKQNGIPFDSKAESDTKAPKVVQTDVFMIEAFINAVRREQRANHPLFHSFPEEVTSIILSYFIDWKWKWDPSTNDDHRLILSDDGMTVTCPTDNYQQPLIFSSMFIGDWISEEGTYSFTFKFNGELIGFSEQIAIGVISKQYDIGNKYGIGVDQNGWSWYVYQPFQSSTYLQTYDRNLSYGLSDGDECIFEVIVKDGRCATNLYHQTLDDTPIVVQFDTVQPPVRVGVSLNTEKEILSLRIIDQNRPTNV